MTCRCILSSATSVVIWFLPISSYTRSRHLSFGLPRFRFPSTAICNIFLVASSLSRLCTCPNHLNRFSLRNYDIGYIEYVGLGLSYEYYVCSNVGTTTVMNTQFARRPRGRCQSRSVAVSSSNIAPDSLPRRRQCAGA